MARETRDFEDPSTSSKDLSIGYRSPPSYRIKVANRNYRVNYPDIEQYVFPTPGSHRGLTPQSSRPPVPKYPPTAKDWENYRSIITQMYSVENRTLKDVMEIMKKRYTFRATRRMFCYRIAEWNLQKNSKSPTQKDLLRLVRQYEKQVLKGQSIYILERPRQESSDQSSASQSSRDDDDQKDITHSGKILQSLLQDLRHRTLVYSKPVNPLLLPHQLRQAEMILKQTDIYYSTLFIPLKISQHDDDIRAGMLAEDMIVSPWDFCNTMDSAFELFNLGQLREAFVLLEDASQMTRPMLAGNHSETLQSLLFNAADWSNSAPPDIFRILWRYLAEMAAIVLGRESPICVVCKAILGMESGGGSLVYENAFRLILGKLGGELGERHKQTLRARDKYNTLVSLTGDLETVERLQKELVQQYEGPLLFSVDGVWAVYALGEIQHRKGDFAAAEETLREALRLSRIFSGDGFPSQIDISIIHSLATAIMERNEYNECEALMREALETCLRNEERGAERDWRTPKILGDLTWILGKAGKEKEVERLKEEYPGAFVEKVPGATK